MKKGNQLIEEINQTKCANNEMVFWWLGQLGYVIKIADKIIYVDAFLSEMEGRQVEPVFKSSEITNADIVIGSHDHIDHIDREAWVGIAKASPEAIFIVPEAIAKKVSDELLIPRSRFIGSEDEKTMICKGLSITGIAAAHEFLDRDPKTGLYPYMGHVVGNGKVSFYHSGDTCIYDGMAEKIKHLSPITVAFIPINGRDAVRYKAGCIGNMTFQEAVDLAGTIKPGLAVPGHYEMFAANSEDPSKFVDYLNAKYPDLKSWVGEHCIPVKTSQK
ncbi:MAG: fold metallo-hydrolase [Herbinix sp.]|jgi:L-ascorbate metabolism protein UlaG (beta-lactamase superfamily)|nr:fold metallo-hydrolase [Herbinix sp.]